MQLSDLRSRARTRYGLAGSTSDSVFSDSVMNDLLNEAHRWLAERTLCYQQTQTYTLPAASSGVSTVALDCNVIQLCDTQNVRWLNGSTWNHLLYADENQLRECFGAFENVTAGTPEYYTLQSGASLDAMLNVLVLPGVSAQVSSGFKVDVHIYPTLMSADADTPALQPAQHPRLIAPTCLRMAELERDRGRVDAPVEYWLARAERDAEELRAVVERARRDGPRRVHQRADYTYSGMY